METNGGTGTPLLANGANRFAEIAFVFYSVLFIFFSLVFISLSVGVLVVSLSPLPGLLRICSFVSFVFAINMSQRNGSSGLEFELQ